MSRGYYKTYGRKGLTPAGQTSIQFDKLFCENSNKPSASKSAGTVGKWGITSFTSLRSSNFMLGRQDENPSCKRPHGESKSKTVYGKTPAPKQPAAVAPSQPRPKKFFKSRNNDSETTTTQSVPPPAAVPPPIHKYTKPLQRSSSLTSNKKAYIAPPTEDEDEEEDEDDCLGDEENRESNQRSNNITLSPPVSSNAVTPAPAASINPPIVLRIFKGTAQLLTEEAFHQHPPNHHHHHHYSKRDARRRSHSGEHVDGVSPKRNKLKIKDIESLRKDLEDEEPSVQEIQPKTDTEVPVLSEAKTEELSHQSPINDLTKDVKVEDAGTKMNKDLQEDPMALPDTLPPKPGDVFNPSSENSTKMEVEVIKENVKLEEEEQQLKKSTYDSVVNPDSDGCESTISAVATTTSSSVATELILENPPAVVAPIPPVEEEAALPPPKVNRLPRKGCIFKSRGASGEKRTAHYIHKWSDMKESEGTVNPSEKMASQTKPKVEGEFEPETLTRITSYHSNKMDLDEDSEPITSVTCSKRSKEYYTVVRNVKKAHQIQESGEFQEFNDDVEYILDALQDNNPISTRCLSAITLASKCMVPAFRMHVRAHGTVTKFFKALHDATKDQRLGMCTATVMFVLSQDRLNMDVDRDSLELMLNLLESDMSHNSALDDCGLSDVQLQKTKERVRSLCQEIQEQGHGKHLNLDNITVGHLAMETLLSLTSRRAGEWFKEELRDLGGLEHIIRTVVDTCQPVSSTVVEWTPQLMDRLRKADRCLRVLENVTLHNEENNNYLLTYGDGILVDTVVRVLRVCDDQLTLHPAPLTSDKHSTGAVIRDCLMSILKVLINLTHDFNNKSFGSTLAGKRQGVIEASLHVILEIPEYVPEEQKFDFIILALILLINLVEHCDGNRKLLMEATIPSDPVFVFSEGGSGNAVSALVALFLQHEELARTEEKKTDAILDGEKPPESQQQKSQEEFIEETVAVLLQKAGRHMEHTLVGAYVAILLGYLTLENQEYEHFIRSHMPDRSYEVMLSVLQKFYNFMTLTAAAGSVSSKGIKSTEMLIKHLTEIDKAVAPSNNNLSS